MKTIFVVNPKAGQGDKIKSLINSIQSSDAGFEIYITKSAGDGRRFVSEYCKDNGPARFIACGGDGTLNEVLNGAIDTPGAQVGVIPIGTGNDFCRNFSKEAAFDNVLLQSKGSSVKCDAIRYTIHLNGEKTTGYCANMFNIGFDCNVADKTAEIKKKPFVSGSMAYFLSILINLVKKKGANLKIELDSDVVHDGELLLTSVANGSFCGGGIKSNPIAEINDGLININIIRNVSRLKFLSLLPHYMKGTFLKLKKIEDVILTTKCEKVAITPNDNKIRVCIDGEIESAEKMDFEIVHNAFDFVYPSFNEVREKEIV